MDELLAATIGSSGKIIDIAIIEQARNDLSSGQESERELLRNNLQYSIEEVERLTLNLSALQTQLTDDSRKTSDLKKAMQSEMLNLRRERDAAKRDTEKQKNIIKKILSTKSWRITAPLRAVRGWF